MSTRTGRGLAGAARRFHALADETRLRILDRLASGERCVCDLTDELATGQSRLSFHLKILKEAGLLRDRRQGRWIYYSLDPTGLAATARLLKSLEPARNGTGDSLGGTTGIDAETNGDRRPRWRLRDAQRREADRG